MILYYIIHNILIVFNVDLSLQRISVYTTISKMKNKMNDLIWKLKINHLLIMLIGITAVNNTMNLRTHKRYYRL